jgi:putative transposase
MKKSRFSEQQIAFILRQADEGTRVEEVCRSRLRSVRCSRPAAYRNVNGRLKAPFLESAPRVERGRRSDDAVHMPGGD